MNSSIQSDDSSTEIHINANLVANSHSANHWLVQANIIINILAEGKRAKRARKKEIDRELYNWTSKLVIIWIIISIILLKIRLWEKNMISINIIVIIIIINVIIINDHYGVLVIYNII